MTRMYAGAGSRMKTVDFNENYGPHIIKGFIDKALPFGTVLDLGAGSGRDLSLALEANPRAEAWAVEYDADNIQRLEGLGVKTCSLDLESQPLPFADESMDLIIMNQVLEHMKEIFWINHEIARTLKVGGHFILGVPNVLSAHNTLLALFGGHPTQAKACSGHVRVFSKRDTLLFYNEAFPCGYELKAFAGSQFYPFPKGLARMFARLLPARAYSIFFLFRKIQGYGGSILTYPQLAHLETSFKLS